MKTNWQKSPLVWRENKTEYISVIFSWDLPKVKTMLQQRTMDIERRIIGGPALKFFPDYKKELLFEPGYDFYGDDIPGILQRFNPLATRTTQGCPNRCSFCVVNQIHPKYKELNKFPVLPMICDDNLLACSQKHFDRVINQLKSLDWCDFNQGVDPKLLQPYHARRFAELKNPIIRLAWDGIFKPKEYEIVGAVTALKKAGIPRKNIRCYVLIGYADNPTDTQYRLETLYHGLGVMPNPMRYQPSTCLEKNDFIGLHWTEEMLYKFMSYWAHKTTFARSVPFDEYIPHKKYVDRNQLEISNK